MSLPAIVDRLAEVPVEFRAHYFRGQDGRYKLNVDPVDGIELGDVATLNAENNRLWEGLDKHLRRAAIEKAVEAAGGDILLLRPHLDPKVIIDRKTLKVKVVNNEGRTEYTLKGCAATVGDLVDEFRQNKAFAAAFNKPFKSSAAEKHDPRGGKNFSDYMADVKAARTAAPAPLATLDPNDPGFNLGAASLYAKGNPEREAMLIRNIEGRAR